MEKQQAEPYAGVAVPVNVAALVAPVAGPESAPAQVVAQESPPYAGSGSIAAASELADGSSASQVASTLPPSLLSPPGLGHQIHFPVAAAPPPTPQLAPAPQPLMARAGVPAGRRRRRAAPETFAIQVPRVRYQECLQG